METSSMTEDEVRAAAERLAIKLVKYHIHRNEIATKSHTKTWMERHAKIKYLVLEE
jgi:hypothetical protein